MARIAISELIKSFQNELVARYQIAAEIRYTRVGDRSELGTSPAYYLELGKFSASRDNVGSPTIRQEIRLLSKESASFVTTSDRIAYVVAQFERISRDLMKTPSFISGAFLENVATFDDAPACYSVENAEDAIGVFGGVAFVFVI